jgi:cholesterol transport system auxiliary component
MRRRSVLTGALALSGCSLVPQTPYVQRRDWPLDVQRPSTASQKRGGRVLLVRNVRAAPGLDARGMQWLQRDGSVHVDFYEQWAVPPAQAVEDDLRRWLTDAGLFNAVVAQGSRMNADFVLEGELNTFMADPNAGVARVALALVLLDQRGGSTKVLMQRTETAEVKLAGNDAPAIAEGMKAAIVEVLRKTESDVAAAVR